MNRRDAVLALFSLGTMPVLTMAQPAREVPRVGIIVGFPETSDHLVQSFIRGMAELGYSDGKNVRFEVRYSGGSIEKSEQEARELIAAGVNLLWIPASASTAAARQATTSLPIVFSLVSDPVASGFVRSLRKPGTNATGISLMSAEMGPKRIQILNETFPKLGRLGVLHNPQDPASVAQLPAVQQGGRALGKKLMVVEASAPEEFGAAFAKLAAWRAQALIMLDTVLFYTYRKTLIDLAVKHRLATINATKEYTEVGSTIAYGADYSDNCRRSAVYVDKILKGAKPADLPVEQPTKFEFVINLKAAKAMGLSIPKAMLLRADRVID